MIFVASAFLSTTVAAFFCVTSGANNPESQQRLVQFADNIFTAFDGETIFGNAGSAAWEWPIPQMINNTENILFATSLEHQRGMPRRKFARISLRTWAAMTYLMACQPVPPQKIAFSIRFQAALRVIVRLLDLHHLLHERNS